MSDESWYVYGVVSTARSPGVADSLAFARDPSLQLVTDGALAAVVRPVDRDEFLEPSLREHLRDVEWVKRLALEHAQVLDRLVRDAVVVPLRICTVYLSQDRLRGMLSTEAELLDRALAHLDGRSEWGVKVFSVRPAELPDAGAGRDESEPAVASAGAAYLLGRLRERDLRAEVDRRIDQACDEIHDLLCAAAVEGGANPPQRQELLNGVYLVEHDAAGRFQQRVGELAARFASLGLDLVTSGPWPAYNFVPERVGAGT